MELSETQKLKWESAVSKALAVFLQEHPINDTDYLSNKYSDGLIPVQEALSLLQGDYGSLSDIPDNLKKFLLEALEPAYQELLESSSRVASRYLKREKFG